MAVMVLSAFLSACIGNYRVPSQRLSLHKLLEKNLDGSRLKELVDNVLEKNTLKIVIAYNMASCS